MRIVHEEGAWRYKDYQPNTQYDNFFLEYLNALSPLFEKAKEKSEFNFVFALLNLRRLSAVKWESFEGLENVKQIFDAVNNEFGSWNSTNAQLGLFRYGLIVESDEIYGFIYNLFRCIKGEQPKIQPFPPIITTNASGKDITTLLNPTDKIAKIARIARGLRLQFGIYDDFYSNKLRNAIFHSTYHLDGYNGSFTVIGSEVVKKNGRLQQIPNPDTVFSHAEMLNILNRSFAYYDALMQLIKWHAAQYQGGEELRGTNNFNGYTFAVVAKEKKGLVALIETDGPVDIPFEARARVGTFNDDDLAEVAKGHYTLRLSKNQRAQTNIDRLPRKWQKLAARYYKLRLGS